jgi:hypothetical protein
MGGYFLFLTADGPLKKVAMGIGALDRIMDGLGNKETTVEEWFDRLMVGPGNKEVMVEE